MPKLEKTVLKGTNRKVREKRKFCVQSGCRSSAVTDGYCRKHYLLNWKHIRFNRQIRNEQRLNNYVNRLVKKYPDEYLEKIKEGIESDEKFLETIVELDSEVAGQEADSTEREYLEKFSRKVKISGE